jgi:peptidoglycan/LPS O-acetylase OafA/YrhL
MQSNHIKALTGLRFVAALSVVFYHLNQANAAVFRDLHPVLAHLVQPVVVVGNLGVDLFFLLSGFVLAHNYLDRLGPTFDLRSAGQFIWLRLSRIWPLYVVVLVGAGLLLALEHELRPGSVDVSRVDGGSFFRQLFLVQQWFDRRIWFTSWSGPAWSLSAEWLAYLAFPFIALVVWRLRELSSVRSMLVGAHLCVAPLLIILVVNHQIGGEYVWLMRIGCEFVAGVIVCAALSRVSPSDRARRRIGWGTVVVGVLVVLVAGGAQLIDGREWLGNVLVFLLPALVGCIALGRGPVERLLGTGVLVLGGEISYALYLIHTPLLGLFNRLDSLVLPGLGRAPHFYLEVAWVVLLGIALSWVLYRFVEVPARRTMRAMANLHHDRPKPIAVQN